MYTSSVSGLSTGHSGAIRRRRRLLATAVVLLSLIVSVALPAPNARATSGTRMITIGSTPVDLTFNAPGTDGSEDPAQLTHLARLINGAPAGSTIRAAIHSFTASEVWVPIQNAKARGVKIQVVHSGHDESQTAAAMHQLLGSDHHWCDHGDEATYGQACVSTDPSGLMHSKFWLFSSTKDSNGTSRSDVTWISSANQTHSSGTDYFNNSQTFYGDSSLYDQMISELWTPLWEERSYADNDFYVASGPRGTLSSSASKSKIYASPEQTTDLVLNRLDYINADADCRIRVMQNMINDTRSVIVDKLVALEQGGCKVWVVSNTIGSANLAAFKAAGIPVRHRNVHDKAILIKARYADSADPRPILFTGSHNLSESALRRNDEILLKISDSEALYEAFYDHFNAAYNTGTPY